MTEPNTYSKDQITQRVGHLDQIAGIATFEATDGLAKGCRVVQVWTGSGLSFSILPDRAMEIADGRYRGLSLDWHAPVGKVHPAFYEPEGMGWLRSYGGGLLVTGGLDQFGDPNEDEGESLGLHGRLSNLPAENINTQTSWVEGRYQLEVSGQIRQARMFGENLVLTRKIVTWMGSNIIQIRDEVENQGFEPHPLMILYHHNLGYPLLSEHTQLVIDAEKTTPLDAVSEAGMTEWMKFQPPTAGFCEQNFLHILRPDAKGRAKVDMVNPHLGLALRWTYPIDQLPYLYEWKMMGQGQYVVGIEPANCMGMAGRSSARENQSLPYLAPGETQKFEIELTVLDNQAGDDNQD